MNLKNGMRLIGFLLLGFILWNVNLAEIFSNIKSVHFFPLLLGVLVSPGLFCIRGYRWFRIQYSLNIHTTLRYCLITFYIGTMGLLTPGRSGELVKVMYLLDRGYEIAESFISVFLDRLMDLIAVFLLSSIYLINFFRFTMYKKWIYLLLIPSLMIIVGFMLVKFRSILVGKLLEIYRALIPSTVKEKANSFLVPLQRIRNKNYWILSIEVCWLTLSGYLFRVLQILFFCWALNITVPYLHVVGISALMSLASTLPISFVGIGTRDAVFVSLFSFYGVSNELALTLSILILANKLLYALLAAILFIIFPPNFKIEKNYIVR